MTRREEIEKASRIAHLDIYDKSVDTFIKGAEWADRTMLDRVCEWLKENMCFTTGIAHGMVCYQCAAIDCFINDLRKAMEE